MTILNNCKFIKWIPVWIVLFLIVSTCIAALESSVSIEGFLQMGDVNITLKEFEKDRFGKEIAFTNQKKVLPGSVVSKIPRIKNVGRDCYVRARLIFDSDLKKIAGIDESNLIGMEQDWRKRGEYYYYEPVLKTGQSVDLFQAIRIPEEWENEHENQNLSLCIDVDAVQAEHFEPVYQDASPWQNLKIEKCIHESNGMIDQERENVLLSVYLDGESGKLVSAPEDFFENLSEIMPGDEKQDQISIQNHTKENMSLYFRTDTQGNDEEEELLRELGLELILDGAVIYKGDLLSEDLEDEILLGDFAAGARSELEFIITAPKEMTNRFAKRSAGVQWIFRTGAPADSTGSPALGGTGGSVQNSVQTGDETPWKFILLLLVVSGIAILTVSYYKGGQKEHHEN